MSKLEFESKDENNAVHNTETKYNDVAISRYQYLETGIIFNTFYFYKARFHNFNVFLSCKQFFSELESLGIGPVLCYESYVMPDIIAFVTKKPMKYMLMENIKQKYNKKIIIDNLPMKVPILCVINTRQQGKYDFYADDKYIDDYMVVINEKKKKKAFDYFKNKKITFFNYKPVCLSIQISIKDNHFTLAELLELYHGNSQVLILLTEHHDNHLVDPHYSMSQYNSIKSWGDQIMHCIYLFFKENVKDDVNKEVYRFLKDIYVRNILMNMSHYWDKKKFVYIPKHEIKYIYNCLNDTMLKFFYSKAFL